MPSVNAKCPDCGRMIRLPFTAVGTMVHRRTCRCGARWQIVRKPSQTRLAGMVIHTVQFARISK